MTKRSGFVESAERKSNFMTKSRLQEKYEKEIKKTLASEFAIKNTMATPKLVKVVINMGVGNVAKNEKGLADLKRDFALVAGQMPSVRAAKVSIASFGLRAGMPVGLSVTLRGGHMYSFLDRLFSVTLPRLRDFRGVTANSFDKQGNYTLGLTEHTVFPEIDISKSAPAHGMEITVVTTAGNIERSKRLLELLGCPFEKGEQK